MQPAPRARLEIVLAALLFSTGGAAIKATSLGSWQVASLRSGVAAAALLLLIPEARRGFGRRSALVAVAYAATLTLFVSANKLTTSASAIFLQDTAPLYVLLLGPLLLRERVGRTDLAFMVLVAAGMALFFVGADAPLRTAPDPLRGNVLAAASGVTWALTIIGLRWAAADPRGGGPLSAVVLGNALAFLACLPAALPLGPARPLDWAAILFLGVVQIGLAYLLLGRGVHHVRALEASLLLLVEPALNPIWSWMVHGERPGLPTLAGGAIVIGATAARSVFDARARPGPAPGAAPSGSG
ncbi:MAG TPA: EamA family transporter [Anaeromyxobacteraceae bacterium]|nr:EamA family transporter [Anaeromyxobacteraceae bacterium]